MNEHGEGYEDSHSDECSPDSEAESGEGMDAVQEEAPRIPHWTDGLAWRFTKKERHAIQSEMNVAYAMTHCPSLRGLVAYDEIKEAVLFVRPAPWDTTERFQPRRWNDTDIAMVRSLLATPIDTNAHHTTGINQLIPTKTVMVGIEMAARERTLNPITDYLKSVRGTWDNIPRVGLLLTRFLGAAPTKIHQEMFTRWMVSAYQRAMRPGCKADHLLIIQGGQGTGKSTFLSVLFKGYHSEDFPRNLHDKDAAYALQDAWVVEAAEMVGMSKAELIDLKKFITQREDRYRKAYGATLTVTPRRVVLAATTNERQYFQDGTGERRFWPITCADEFSYKIEDLEAVRDQVWAEVVHLAETGKRWWFDRKDLDDAELLMDLASLHAEKKVEDALTPFIERFLIREGWPKELTIVQVTTWLEIRPEEAQRHAKRVGSALRKLGYDSQNVRGANGDRHRSWVRLEKEEKASAPVDEADAL